MSEQVPVLRIGSVLLVFLPTDLEDGAVGALQDDLGRRIVSTATSGVILDITAVEIVDTFMSRMLASMAGVSRLLGAETIVVGMSPDVAVTLVQLGLSLNVRTAVDLDAGLRALPR